MNARIMQKLWLLCKSRTRKISKVNEALVDHLVTLELAKVNGKEFQLTDAGKRFSSLESWRFWEPSSSILNKMGEESEGLFINKTEFDSRPVVIDLFAGVGGLSHGFTAAGFKVALAIDNDKEACEAHKINFPETHVIHDGVEGQLDKINKLMETISGGEVDGVIGGPPCQGFSYIGERVDTDERNLLTTRFVEVVEATNPKFFVMENVPGLATIGLPPKFSVYLKRLAKSIGQPASSIVDSLPAVPKSIAKRDRQYRKKLVSGLVNELKAHIAEEFQNRLSKDLLESLIKDAYSFFRDKLAVSISDIWPDTEVKTLISINERSISIIAFSSVMELLVQEKVIKDSECESYLASVANSFSGELQDTINTVIEEYDSSPSGGYFKGKKYGPILLHILERLSEKYEIAQPTVLNAASYGTPQNRTRIFIVGIRKDLGREFTFPAPKYSDDDDNLPSPLPVSAAIGDLPDIDVMQNLIDGHEFGEKHLLAPTSEYSKRMRLEYSMTNDWSIPRPDWDPSIIDCSNRTLHADYVIERLKQTPPGTQEKTSHKPRLHPEKPSPTLRAGTREAKGSHTAVRPVHYNYHRVVSVREGARIMGYPDWMMFHKTKWHGFRLVGNGVPFHLGNEVAKQIRANLFEQH